jgi:hypothetical protein
VLDSAVMDDRSEAICNVATVTGMPSYVVDDAFRAIEKPRQPPRRVPPALLLLVAVMSVGAVAGSPVIHKPKQLRRPVLNAPAPKAVEEVLAMVKPPKGKKKLTRRKRKQARKGGR